MKQNYSFSRPLMPESHASGRLQFIDGAKGFALICVMLGHTEGGAVVTYIDNMLLPVFWVAAGYTSHPDFRISRRFRSLFLPYLFMSLACLIFMLLVNPASVGMRSMIGILYSRFKLFPFADAADSFRMMNIDNSVLWFLTSMFTAYCLFRLLLDIRCDRNRILGAIACVAVGYVYPYIPLLLPWSLDTAFFIAPLMLGGNMVRRYGILEHYGWKLLLLSVPAYMACNYFAGATNYSIREMGVFYPASFGCGLFGAVALFVVFRLPFCSYMSRAFAFLNAKALYIFGLQLVFLETGLRFGMHFGLPLWLTVSLQIIIAVAGGYLSGVIAGKLTDLFPRRG